MTLEGVYGTRPDLLPRSMVRVVRSVEPDRRISWAGVNGVELLRLDEHLREEGQSLGRCPRTSDGGVDWDAMTEEVLGTWDGDSTDMGALLEQYTSNGAPLVLFWGSLSIPSVKAGLATLLPSLPDIVETMPEFWIYSPADDVIVEYAFSGTVTAAHLPNRPAGGH